MEEVWRHLVDTVLARYITNTVLLALGVGLVGLIIGTLTAWLSANFEFPGQRLFHWALLLPLAVPTYATAFSYGGLCEFSGPLQTTLREILALPLRGLSSVLRPGIMSQRHKSRSFAGQV